MKQHLTDGVDVNAKDVGGNTPLDMPISPNKSKTAELLRNHGDKRFEELKDAAQ